MDREDQRKTHTSGHVNYAVSVCHQCGWPFPNPHPSARVRRAHKRICGTIEGYKLVDSEGNSHSHLSDEDHKMNRLISNRSEDDVYSDAAAEFSDSGSGAGSNEQLANVRQPVAEVENILIQSSKNDPNADSRTEDSSLLLHGDNNGSTDYLSKSEIQKETSDENEKTKSIDDVANNSLTSVGQETNGNGRKEADLDSNLPNDMISPSKILEETTEAVPKLEDTVKITSEPVLALPADGDLQSLEECSEGFHVKNPQSDLPLEVESVEHVKASDDTVETKVDTTEEVKFVNSGETTIGVPKLEETVKITSESLPADGVLQSQEQHSEGFNMIPQSDLPLDAESAEHVNAFDDTINTKVEATEEIKFVNSGDLIETCNRKEEGNVNVHVLSVPDDIHTVDRPEIMLEDFKDHHGVKLYQSATLESSESIKDKEDYVKSPVSGNFLALGSTQLSGGYVISSSDKYVLDDSIQSDLGGGNQMVREVAHEKEANLSLIKVKSSESIKPDEIGVPIDTVMAKRDKNSSVCSPEEEESYVNKGTKEDDCMDPKTTPESARNLSEIEVIPATNIQEGDDVDSKGEIGKDDIIRDFGEHLKAETGDDNSNRLKEENLQEVHDAGNKGNGEIEKNDETGVPSYDAAVHVKAENRLDKAGGPKEESAHPIITPESISKISELQVNPESDLCEGDDASVQEKGKIEERVEEQTQSAGDLLETQIIAEDVKYESLEKLPEMESTDKGIASDSNKLGTDTVSGTQLVSDSQLGKIEHKLDENGKAQEDFVVVSGAALSDGGVDATPSQKASEDHVTKEQHPSDLGAKSSVGDNCAREFIGGAFGLGSQPLQEESEKKQLGPSAIDVLVDSSSQSGSLEGNWGSVSVFSTQSDAQAIIDAEALRPTDSQVATEKVNSKQSKAASGGEHSDKSDMFEPPSFMTLVEPRGVGDQNANDSEIQTMQNPQQSNQSSLQAGWFPSLTNVVNESQGRKKNEEIIAKVTNWSTVKQHTPLKNLLSEASQEYKAKSPNPKENLAPSGPVATTVNSILDPQSPTSKIASRETIKDWDSPARYHSDIKREKRKAKGRPSWVQFVCCSSSAN